VTAPAVEFSNVSKSYSIYAAPRDRLKEFATFQRRSFHTEFWALRDVSFDVHRGETFCVVGENGSGKSTLLQICAGILAPTSGTAIAHGRIAALLDLGLHRATDMDGGYRAWVADGLPSAPAGTATVTLAPGAAPALALG